MSSIIFTAARTVSAYQSGGILSALASSGIVGSLLGGVGVSKLPDRQVGARLDDLKVQTATYGKSIPIVYGTVKLAGNIIWARDIEENVSRDTISRSGKGGRISFGGGVSQDQVSYSYTATFAIGICAGEISSLKRVWANYKLLDLSQYDLTIYYGSESQEADPIMEGFDGVGNVPAYRGLAYIVFENFSLDEFGNRIPNFTFEISRNLYERDSNLVENKITAVTMIPGSGEFVYDTDVQYKIPYTELEDGEIRYTNYQEVINSNNFEKKADSLVSLDQLQNTLPNVEWVAVVVTWFVDDLDIAHAEVLPRVEYQDNKTITQPDLWNVANIGRSEAKIVSYDANNSPIYGGTISDNSLLRYLEELRSRGIKIVLYPLLFVDQHNKPWRGYLTGDVGEIDNFFTKTNGYNRFILHYAQLVRDKVDAFIIGSELIGLTSIRDSDNSFPVVDLLVSLADQVKSILTSNIKVSYAADWSEYHHTAGGFYHLDKLWSADSIDFVGIDAYFPLTNWVSTKYDKQEIIDGWTSGEGYDYYYEDSERLNRVNLEAPYAWKNIEWWWSNDHYNPGNIKTDWVPRSKKIWFTEYGFSSVDKATNQPNVFYNPESIDSAFPRYSNGQVDFLIQRIAIDATEDKWFDSEMIENKFLWTWDARPFPFWPDLIDVWSDGYVWQFGHWVQGKLGLIRLSSVLRDLCCMIGVEDDLINIDDITDYIQGVAYDDNISARDAISILQDIYFFDLVESEGIFKFISRYNKKEEVVIDYDSLINDNEQSAQELQVTRESFSEIPKDINIIFQNLNNNYQNSTQQVSFNLATTNKSIVLRTAVIMDAAQSFKVAQQYLASIHQEQNQYRFDLPISYLYLEPSDIIELNHDNYKYRMRIIDISIISKLLLRVSAVSADLEIYDPENILENEGEKEVQVNKNELIREVAASSLQIIDIPSLINEAHDQPRIFIAMNPTSIKWQGSDLYHYDGGSVYNYLGRSLVQSNTGFIVNLLPKGKVGFLNKSEEVYVNLVNESLQLNSVSYLEMLEGQNIALIGQEIIAFQFAEMVSNGVYKLSGLLRGLFSTENFMDNHFIGEDFILLNENLYKYSINLHELNLSKPYKAVSIGQALDDNDDFVDFIYTGKQFKPYSPCHISVSKDSDNNLNITWIRRSRQGYIWSNNEVPIAETSEKYEIEIYNSNQELVKSLSSLTSSVVYSFDQQSIDGFVLIGDVMIKIYQISDLVGRGYVAEYSVSL